MSHPRPPASFDDLYRRERGFVLRTLARHGVTEDQREDAAQEVFMVVHRRWADWADDRAPVRSWLYGIARRVASTRRRGLRRRERHLGALPEAASVDLDELLERERNKRALTLALAQLEGCKREVFERATLEEHSGPEIAASLGVAVNTVYSRLRLARSQLVADARRLRLAM